MFLNVLIVHLVQFKVSDMQAWQCRLRLLNEHSNANTQMMILIMYTWTNSVGIVTGVLISP